VDTDGCRGEKANSQLYRRVWEEAIPKWIESMLIPLIGIYTKLSGDMKAFILSLVGRKVRSLMDRGGTVRFLLVSGE
jgi:hypothetical protein